MNCADLNCERLKMEDTLKCEACAQDGIEKSATAFCVDCQDFLCLQCSEQHCLPKPMKYHKLLSHEQMPKRKAATSLSEECAKHKSEIIKFFCKNHNIVGCSICIVTVHRTCKNVYALSDLTKNVEQSQLCREIKTELKEIEDLFCAQSLKITNQGQISEQCYKSVILELEKRREEINKQFAKLEQDMKAELSKVCKENSSKMKQLSDSCTTKLDSIEKIKSDLELLEETKQEKQLFIALKKTEMQLEQMKSELSKIEKVTTVKRVELRPSAISKSLVERKDSLGLLQVCTRQTDTPDRKGDGYQATGISKLVELSPNATVATDYRKCQVRVYGQNFYIIQQVSFATGPWDLTKSGADIVAVTFPHEKKIKFLYIRNNIQEVGNMLVPGQCRGIAAVDNKFVVTFSNPAGLKILNEIGVLVDVPLITTTTALREPAYVAADENKNIFVTDPANAVVKISIDGRIERVSRSIKMPLHIGFFTGALLISECKSGIIHFLNYDLIQQKTDCTFTNFDGEISLTPTSISLQAVMKINAEDYCMPHKLQNARNAMNNSDNTDAGSGSASGKKCIIS